MKVKYGKRYNYLDMILDYNIKGKLRVDMRYYIDTMIKEYPDKITPSKVP